MDKQNEDQSNKGKKHVPLIHENAWPTKLPWFACTLLLHFSGAFNCHNLFTNSETPDTVFDMVGFVREGTGMNNLKCLIEVHIGTVENHCLSCELFPID